MPVCVIVNSSFSFTLTVYLYITHIFFWSDPWRVAFSTSHREPLTRLSLPLFPLSDATTLPFPLQQSHKRAGHVTSASNSLCAKQTGHSLLQNQAHIWSPVTHSLIGFFLLQRVTYTHSRFSHVFQYTNAVKREKRKLSWPKLKY